MRGYVKEKLLQVVNFILLTGLWILMFIRSLLLLLIGFFLPGFLLHLYRLNCLQILASQFGRFIGTGNATLNRTRAIGVRLCVKVDIQDEPIGGFPFIISLKNQLWQELDWWGC